MDLGVDSSAFLQHDILAEPIITFFLRYFENRLLRTLPTGGVDVIVHSRFDSAHIPPASLRVCQSHPVASVTMTMRLYNLTGEGTAAECLGVKQ